MKFVEFNKYCRRCEHWKDDSYGEPCNTCLSTSATDNSHKPIHFKEAENAKIKGYFTSLHRVKPYLYLIEYDELDYHNAYRYYNTQHTDISAGSCSSFTKGQYFARNLDWIYSNQAEFLVWTPPNGSKYATIGMASGFSALTDEYVHSGEYNDIYKVLPFQLMDGMNEKGLVASCLVVPIEEGHEREIYHGAVQDLVTLDGFMLIRYMLDRFASAKSAVEHIRDYAAVKFSASLKERGYELHYMVADKTSTYSLEFIDGHAVCRDISVKPIMTNFYLEGVQFNEDGTVYTPETQVGELNAYDHNYISLHGSGLERYNLIVNKLNDGAKCLDILDDLEYTRAYPTSEDPALWYTEFVGVNGLTVKSTPETYNPTRQAAGVYYSRRTREDGMTWHTMHSIVYAVRAKEIVLQTQEDGKWVKFGFYH